MRRSIRGLWKNKSVLLQATFNVHCRDSLQGRNTYLVQFFKVNFPKFYTYYHLKEENINVTNTVLFYYFVSYINFPSQYVPIIEPKYFLRNFC